MGLVAPPSGVRDCKPQLTRIEMAGKRICQLGMGQTRVVEARRQGDEAVGRARVFLDKFQVNRLLIYSGAVARIRPEQPTQSESI